MHIFGCADPHLALERLPHHAFALVDRKRLRAGRLPLWIPDIYAGAPFVVWDKYSPFSLVYTLFPAPLTLAWLQLLKSVVAGLGAYAFFHRVLGVGFWPAAVGAWCYPLTGFFIYWQGYPQTFVTAWFPWLLLAESMSPTLTVQRSW